MPAWRTPLIDGRQLCGSSMHSTAAAAAPQLLALAAAACCGAAGPCPPSRGAATLPAPPCLRVDEPVGLAAATLLHMHTWEEQQHWDEQQHPPAASAAGAMLGGRHGQHPRPPAQHPPARSFTSGCGRASSQRTTCGKPACCRCWATCRPTNAWRCAPIRRRRRCCASAAEPRLLLLVVLVVVVVSCACCMLHAEVAAGRAARRQPG